LRTNQPAQAKLIGEEVFRVGLALGREDDALAWELRAATSLARLHQRQGRQALARDVLAPVYRWFTEEFATADLREAQRLRKARDADRYKLPILC
jgi:predicted ATPase